jgi:acetate kinase
MNVLSLNPGSSSLKFGLFAESELQRGEMSGAVDDASVKAAIAEASAKGKVDSLACRVVHGGDRFSAPTLVDDSVLDQIEELAPLAPLHNEIDVRTIRAPRPALPQAPIYAVFDTAFHRTLPPIAFTYALPANLAAENGLRRYGFHGISYRHVTSQLPQCRRLVACHLGNGASVCAIRDGVSVDTSMGMTPLEGLVMGTRSGDVDPGLVLYLQQHLRMSADEIDDLLNHRSGLLGISDLSGDVRDLLNSPDPKARLALAIFCYRVAKYIGAYAVALEGLDGIAFTGGIGENSPFIRKRVCERLAFLGVRLAECSGSGPGLVSAEGSIPVWVVAADEEAQMAREVRATLHEVKP